MRAVPLFAANTPALPGPVLHALRGAALGLAAGLPLGATEPAAPSGQPLEFVEVIAEELPEGPLLRYRYVAPEAGTLTFEAREADFAHLCQAHALPHARAGGQEPARIVVSLAEAPVAFAVYDPDVAQFFEAYRIEDGRCIWEPF
jgi:hypothetical protein